MSRSPLAVRMALAAFMATASAGGLVSVVSAAASFTVTTATDIDDGACNAAHCSLREALNAANGSASGSVISFAIPGAGPHTIAVTSPLPQITRPMVIDGYTQAGAAVNSAGSGSNAAIKVRLDGALLSGPGDGLVIAANDVRVRGLSVTTFRGAGIKVASGAGGVIEGNLIGTTPGGIAAAANYGPGVHLVSSGGTVGGTDPGSRNVLSGNKGAGVLVATGTSGNQVLGNLIGTTASGAAILPNSSHGVYVQGSGNVVGGTAPGARNVISGNNGSGVLIGFNSNALLVQGNYIGLDAAGNQPLPNITHGVIVDGPNSMLGGVAAGAGNVISGNSGAGVLIPRETTGTRVQGNLIGTNAAGTERRPNRHDGVTVFGSDNTIGATEAGGKNTISGNARDGVLLTSRAAGNVLQGNHIGLSTTGTAVPNSRDGVAVLGSGNTIGGRAAGARNIISGNDQDGVELECKATLNQLLGNYIGTNPTGTAAVPNSFGVKVSGPANAIGGSEPGAGNLISGNRRDGLEIGCKGAGGLIQGNLIGTNAIGAGAVPNKGSGILVELDGVSIGGTMASEGNVISGNDSHGIYISAGISGAKVLRNHIGVNPAGNAAVPNGGNGVLVDGTGNAIGWSGGLGNVIAGNRANGVELGGAASSNAVKGNTVGANAAGTQAVPNAGNGVMVYGAGNIVGGPTAEDRNVISGNGSHGMVLGVNAKGNWIQGNYIGTDIAGAAALKNASSGITIDGDANYAVNNVISGNGGNGLTLSSTAVGDIVVGNKIGTNAEGTLALANSANGVMVNGADNIIGWTGAAWRNIIAGNGQHGVVLSGTGTGTQLYGNYVGVNAEGGGLGNGAHGVVVQGNANMIGSDVADAGNIISANSNGVVLEVTASSNRVMGNIIGLTPDGAAQLGNRANGVVVSGTDNTVGGTTATAGNLISGNAHSGVLVGLPATGNRLLGNAIGTNASGMVPLGNLASGVLIQGSGNSVGGTEVGAGNIVGFNGKDGLLVQDTGRLTPILGNRFHGNTYMGIALGTDGVTPNDSGDGDNGANDRQNYPELAPVVAGSSIVGGVLSSTPNTAFRVELFVSDGCDSSGFGEGGQFVGTVNVTSNAGGTGAFSFTAPSSITAGKYVTSTATSITLGNTSEFSRCVRAQ